eukprot:gene5844-15882_t
MMIHGAQSEGPTAPLFIDGEATSFVESPALGPQEEGCGDVSDANLCLDELWMLPRQVKHFLKSHQIEGVNWMWDKVVKRGHGCVL